MTVSLLVDGCKHVLGNDVGRKSLLGTVGVLDFVHPRVQDWIIIGGTDRESAMIT